MTDRVGQQLGNYRLQRLLGRGGFAVVYLGEHAYLHKPAALKLLHLHLDEHDADQFLREAQTLAKLDHPHIVRVLDFAVRDGLPYLVMDYAVGGTLRTKHPTGTRVLLEQILSYVSQVASALQYAHDQRLMHRDIKPENMLLDAREQVLLADFGLALLTPTHSGSTQAMDPAMAGTAPYLAPEQVQGQPRPASDQYALAVVVYEWLAGQRPFKGTPIEVAMQHVSAMPPPLHEQLPDLSPEVEQAVMRALAKAPEQRFPSVQDFATALHHAAHPAGDASITSAVPTTSAATPGERTATEPFWKVPTSLTSLVDREQDVAAICAMLARPEVRLLTLLGVGGIGKTRLSIQVASQLRDRFVDGVCFVGLAPLSDPALVLSSIAHELGLQEAGVQPLVETVQAWLRDKHFLLLLDNFEQIVSAAPLLEDLLAACPWLAILVTSRELLHLLAEHLFPVPSLSFPDLARLPEQEDLGQYAAVSLFVQRAQALKPDFRLTPANTRSIAEICVRLDGLPLAIELAAARIRVLPPQALLARLSQRLQVLTSGSRTLPQRQQTLRNTIEWSYKLLDSQEQQLFRRLSIFAGGCTLEAVEAISTALGDGVKSTLDTVASLVDKSLLQHMEQEAGLLPRFVMLETIREYGLERLEALGEIEAVRKAHAAYFLALAEEAYLKTESPEQSVWLRRLDREHDNLHAVMHWSLEQTGSGREMALRLGIALQPFWNTRGYHSEGRSFLERALVGSDNVEDGLRAGTLLTSRDGQMQWQGMMALGFLWTERAIAMVFTSFGQLGPALSHGQEALRIATEIEHQEWRVAAYYNIGHIYLQMLAPTLALQALETGLSLAWKLNSALWITWLIADQAQAYLLKQELLRAEAALKAIMPREQSPRMTPERYIALDWAELTLAQGEPGIALQIVEHLLTSAPGRVPGEPAQPIPHLLKVKGEALVALQQLNEATQALEAAKQGALERQDPAVLWTVHRSLGRVYQSLRREEEARGEFAAARHIIEKLATTMDDASLREQFLRTALGSLPQETPLPPRETTKRAVGGLTARECEVAALLAQGKTSREIAELLVVSERTAEVHVSNILGKLGFTSRAQIAVWAVEKGLTKH